VRSGHTGDMVVAFALAEPPPSLARIDISDRTEECGRVLGHAFPACHGGHLSKYVCNHPLPASAVDRCH